MVMCMSSVKWSFELEQDKGIAEVDDEMVGPADKEVREEGR